MDGPADLECSFEDFEKLDLIGSGGNADVHRARATVDGRERTVALKTPRMANYETVDADFFDSFVEEAELWNQLDDHDNIVSVLDWGQEPMPWIALEYLEAGNLDDVAEDLSIAERADLFEQLCEAVFHAHRHGITHGDLKPENVLLTRENGRLVPKIGDWGLATVLLEHSQSAEGLTLAYSAPEQVDPDEYGPTNDRTDIYQLGALGYELFTGRPPFRTESTAALVSAILNDEPLSPSEVRSSLPSALDSAFRTALAKDKTDRYESVLYLRDAVRAAFEGESISGGGATPASVEQTGTDAPSPDDSATVSSASSASGGSADSEGQLTFGTEDDQSKAGQTSTDAPAKRPPEPDTGTPTSDGPDGTVGRLYRWFHRPAAGLDFEPRGAVGDVRFAFAYARTIDWPTLKRGAIATLATAVFAGAPILVGYALDVIRATATTDEAAPSIQWGEQFKHGLAMLILLLGGFIMAAMFVGASPTEEGPLATLGALVLLGWMVLFPAVAVAYGITRNLRTTLDPRTLRRIVGIRYLGMLLGVGVIGFLGYFLVALSAVTIVGILVTPLVLVTAVAAFAGRRYRDVDLS